MTATLKSLRIENFRSIRGNVVVPLDAPVVLIHGSNGMGKTSVLSALELGLTGSISHLDRNQSPYRQYLTHYEAASGSIEMSVENLVHGTALPPGSVAFSPTSFTSSPVLSPDLASFFSQRCYLPQAVLGRLLEIYDEQKKGDHSELTQFVKEILKIDPLDALVDGLDHAFHVSRVRKIAPSYKQLEALQDNYRSQKARLNDQITAATSAVSARQSTIVDMLAMLFPNQVWSLADLETQSLRLLVGDRTGDESALAVLANEKAELFALQSQIGTRDASSADLDIASKQREEAQQARFFQTWSETSGMKLLQVLTELRALHPSLPQPDLDFSSVVSDATKWCNAEIARYDNVLSRHEKSGETFRAAGIVVERATTRIREINEALAQGAKDARTLANALAGVAPHVEGDMCPVCNRDFGELDKGALTAHIAATIASLTSEAGRLQALSSERANESERLSVAQRDMAAAEGGVLSADVVLDSRQKRSELASILVQLAELRHDAEAGTEFGRALAAAREQLGVARRALRYSVDLLPEIEATVARASGRPLSSFENPRLALNEAIATVFNRVADLEGRLSRRVSLASELGQLDRELGVMRDRLHQGTEIERRLAAIEKTILEIGTVRDRAKVIANAATGVRSQIVRSVFSGSLNKVWRDLFVRLAPAEQFVPQFRLPDDDSEKVEAILETVHRSGRAAGSPGAMLSQGNLNTAALTLFLALHLSVPTPLPWLILDDPVQSMDDVHIAQFAALLRTLSKGLGKQVVIAVHERALFDYLALELSPAFAGDSLITVEISRSFEGTTIADPRYFEFVDDKAVAA
ncbi:AAA family ATPase [Sinorhizobium medicae]|uniref:AAA family ATPase n=1 Tax=Sinorhizobium medicae TaxID=110321 RepID=UPI002AF6CC5D|nr:AAA family ATPase [Sinorhizobium medicae]WQO71597.1 AAA family ATPase [Sinorhizobium medicae]